MNESVSSLPLPPLPLVGSLVDSSSNGSGASAAVPPPFPAAIFEGSRIMQQTAGAANRKVSEATVPHIERPSSSSVPHQIALIGREAESPENFPAPILGETPWSQMTEHALQNKNLKADFSIDARYQITPDSKITSREETVESIKRAATEYFNLALENLVEELQLNEETSAGVKRDATSKFQEIIQTHCGSLQEPTSQLIQMLHRDMTKMLFFTRKTYASPERELRIYPVPTQKGTRGEQEITGARQEEPDTEQKYCVIRPAPPIENMALAGGGVRGVGYVTVIKAMEEAGTFANLKNISGTSVGSITGALLAGGLNADEIAKVSNVPIFQALTSPQEFSSTQRMKVTGIFEGRFIPEMVQQKISESIATFFATETQFVNQVEQACQRGEITEMEMSSLLHLHNYLTVYASSKDIDDTKKSDQVLQAHQDNLIQKKDIRKIFNQQLPEITFGHLSALHKIAPSKFRELTIVGFNATRKESEYYNVATTPEMAIADAVRISMSLPVIFRPPTNEKKETLLDGTFSSPIPAEVFSDKSPEKTLLLGFVNDGWLNQYLHAPQGAQLPSIISRVDPITEQLFGAQISKALNRSAAAYRRAGPNVLQVAHGSLGAASFFAGDADVKAAQLQAETRVWEWLVARQNQAMHTVFDNLEQACAFMSEEELQKIIESYGSGALAVATVGAEKAANIVETAQKILAEKQELKLGVN